MKFRGLEIEAVIIEDFNNELGYAVLPLKKKINIWGEDYLLKCESGGDVKNYIIGVKPMKKRGVILSGERTAISIFKAYKKWSPVPYKILSCEAIGGEGGELK